MRNFIGQFLHAPAHVGYVHQCLHKREPCGFSTFFNVSVAKNVTACDVRVTSRTNQ